MKINEIWGGGSWKGIGKELAKSWGGIDDDSATAKFFRDQPGHAHQPVAPSAPKSPAPSPAPQQTTQQPAQDQHWTTMPNGVQLSLATRDDPATGKPASPTTARYNKQVYRLTPDDRWVDVRDKPVSQTMTSLLNQALGQT